MRATIARKRNTLYGSGRTVRGRAVRRSGMSRASDGPDLPFAVPVGQERVREAHGSAFGLVVLEERRERARERQSRGVQGVDVLCLRPGPGAETNSRAAGLEILKIAAGGDLEPPVLPGRPRFEVVALGSGEAQVPRR